MRFPSPTEWDNVYRVLFSVAILALCWWAVSSLVVTMGGSSKLGAVGLLIGAPWLANCWPRWSLTVWPLATAPPAGWHCTIYKANTMPTKGHRIDVLEWRRRFRWLRVASLRAVLRSLPRMQPWN